MRVFLVFQNLELRVPCTNSMFLRTPFQILQLRVQCTNNMLPRTSLARPWPTNQIQGKFDSINSQLNNAKDIYSDGDQDLEAAAAEAAAEAEVRKGGRLTLGCALFYWCRVCVVECFERASVPEVFDILRLWLLFITLAFFLSIFELVG